MSRPFQVLIVDDEHDICEILSEEFDLLSKKRNVAIATHTETSGTSAIEKISNNNYDLIILDLKIPDKHGNEIYSHMKSTGSNSETPVIFLSGTIQEHPWASDDHVYYVSKPILSDRLNRLVTMLLKLNKGEARSA